MQSTCVTEIVRQDVQVDSCTPVVVIDCEQIRLGGHVDIGHVEAHVGGLARPCGGGIVYQHTDGEKRMGLEVQGCPRLDVQAAAEQREQAHIGAAQGKRVLARCVVPDRDIGNLER